MSLADRDYTKKNSRGTNTNSQQCTRVKNNGKHVDVEDFMQKNYAKAVRERDTSLLTKIKNKLLRLLKL